MTTIPIPTNLTSSYTSSYTAVYDAWNRLVSLSSGSTTVATYSYDGLNRRIVKGIYVSGSLDHNEHAYFNENWQILEVRKEVSGTINSNPLEQYVWHPFYIDAPILRDYDSALSGSPIRYYYAFDANYNVTAATSSAGSPSERYYYSPYGNVTFLDGNFNALGTQQSQIGNSVTYTGRQYDSESGTYNFRHRCYHSTLGTFIARDPIGYHNGLSLYRPYFAPNMLDPMGTALCDCCTKAVQATGGYDRTVLPTLQGKPTGGKPCKVHISSQRSGQGCHKAAGYTSWKSGGRKICLDCRAGVGTYEGTIKHELTHAAQFCHSPGIDSDNCVEREREAYEAQCPQGPNHKRCVDCGIWFSCKDYPAPVKDLQRPNPDCDFLKFPAQKCWRYEPGKGFVRIPRCKGGY